MRAWRSPMYPAPITATRTGFMPPDHRTTRPLSARCRPVLEWSAACASSPSSISPAARRSGPAGGATCAAPWPRGRGGTGGGARGAGSAWRTGDAARARGVAADLRTAGLDAAGLGCDVTREAEVDALVGHGMAERGRPAGPVCNPRGAFTPTYLPHASIDEMRRTLELNVTGTYISAQAGARAMI